jgi:hypothetical protein
LPEAAMRKKKAQCYDESREIVLKHPELLRNEYVWLSTCHCPICRQHEQLEMFDPESRTWRNYGGLRRVEVVDE